ncbi:MAG: class I SAM-dependent methyltransferase [Nonomuraea sp.]|nr:class I SAM-dependent methyltransferase [Nonomuraea sp.]NUT38751.1 class I SAM-dependent methyltransferase [Thermoactinospora sp.]
MPSPRFVSQLDASNHRNPAPNRAGTTFSTTVTTSARPYVPRTATATCFSPPPATRQMVVNRLDPRYELRRSSQRRGVDRGKGDGDMSGTQLYDTIGATYTVTRRTEPRIAARILAALGDARTVLNVGAGTGSYEPAGREVTAVEPSALMRAQRPADAAPCVAATAEHLPFEDGSFDAAMAVNTVHHWPDPIAGLREMRRVARRVVVFTFDCDDPGWGDRFWLVRDYLPEVAGFPVGRPSLAELAGAIGARVEPVPVPWDCVDGFFEAHWRRPEAYLDERVRRGVSVWAKVGPEAEARAVRELRDDLRSGRWAERNRDIVDLDAAELGLRLLVA